ncbi:bifunctional nuclease family protein [Agromyces sp. H3Y2-19a]|uniref:bifunctional nuclease family protein n=1 Tax=Agromyces TaxID=33877 RepID=UPI001E35BE27|nr:MULTISPECIES: bifunctional nuclease family protein [Agromyces]MCD5348198.1 bifunctional nuclease family protein [Agromyces sp. S2-1-8]MDF0514197.1 bifunctional nuclease family protein [Agromyces chromiiresistens]
MIQVRVLGIALDQSGQHLVLLRPLADDPDGPVVVPIWIGRNEANSILIALSSESTPRPLTHDLMTTLLGTLGARLERVEVTKLDEGTFYAELTLVTRQGPRIVDARPSDAIALAVRSEASIWIAEQVLEDAGIPAELAGEAASEPSGSSHHGDASGGAAMPIDESKLEEFKRFLDDVDPEDFEG